jgi:hypothetical protein
VPLDPWHGANKKRDRSTDNSRESADSQLMTYDEIVEKRNGVGGG